MQTGGWVGLGKDLCRNKKSTSSKNAIWAFLILACVAESNRIQHGSTEK